MLPLCWAFFLNKSHHPSEPEVLHLKRTSLPLPIIEQLRDTLSVTMPSRLARSMLPQPAHPRPWIKSNCHQFITEGETLQKTTTPNTVLEKSRQWPVPWPVGQGGLPVGGVIQAEPTGPEGPGQAKSWPIASRDR